MGAIIRWNPYRSISNINRELESIFEDFGFPALRRGRAEEEGGEAGWLPAIDLSETQAAYVIKADLPGVTKEDVKVTMSEDILTITGEKKTEKEIKDQSYHSQ